MTEPMRVRLKIVKARPRTVQIEHEECSEPMQSFVELEQLRPKTRADCANVPRPCPYVSCRMNLYLDVSSKTSLKFNFPGVDPDEMGESCALDVADKGDRSLESVGVMMNLTRERIRQYEVQALKKLEFNAKLRIAADVSTF